MHVDQLSFLSNQRGGLGMIENKLGRIRIDEDQAMKNEGTKRQRALLRAAAPCVRCSTGTVHHDSMKGVCRHVALLETPELHHSHDIPDLPVPPGQQCDRVVGWNEADLEDHVEHGCFCREHRPDDKRFNRNRSASIDPSRRRDRHGQHPVRENGQVIGEIEQPFAENPSDLYHPENPNKLQCLTLAAFNYWIAPHLN